MSNPIPAIHRGYPVAPIPPTGLLRAGAWRIDITPRLGLPLSGYSFLDGPHAQGTWGRLFANALVLDDGHGERVGLVQVDLHVGSRYLVERAARQVAGSTGLSVDRILLAASHTHKGPGHLYGNPFYDNLAAHGQGFDLETSDWLADRIATALEQACRELRPARVGAGHAHLWGWSLNRSLSPALENLAQAALEGPTAALDEAEEQVRRARQASTTLNEGEPPAGLAINRVVVDSRVHCLAAAERDSGRPIGAFAVFGVHPCLVHKSTELYAADAFGVASRAASDRLLLQHGVRVPVGVAAGAEGDTNLIPPWLSLPDCLDRMKRRQDTLRLSQEAGSEVGEGVARAVQAALDAAVDALRITVCYDERTIRGAPTRQGELAPTATVGLPTLGGSEFAQGIISEFIREGMRTVEEGLQALLAPDEAAAASATTEAPAAPLHPAHRPKVPLPAPLARAREARGGEPPDRLPLRAIGIGDTWLLGVPGEPTTWTAQALRTAVRGHTRPDARVLVCGLSGEYCSYFSTAAEYRRQHYEGSSTVWGRHAGDWLVEAFDDLVGRRQRLPPAGGTATFVGEITRPQVAFRPLVPGGTAPVDRPQGRWFQVKQDRHRDSRGEPVRTLVLSGQWQAPPVASPPAMGESPWISIEWESSKGWVPLVLHGATVDDVERAFELEREPRDNHVVWSFRCELPLVPAWRGRRLRYRVVGPAAALRWPDQPATSPARGVPGD